MKPGKIIKVLGASDREYYKMCEAEKAGLFFIREGMNVFTRKASLKMTGC